MPALSGSGGVSKVLHAMCHPPGPFGRIREPIHKVSMGCSKKKILIHICVPWERLRPMRHPRGPFGSVREPTHLCAKVSM